MLSLIRKQYGSLLFIVLILISGSSVTAQQTTLLTESFESGSGVTLPAGWVVEQVSGTQPGVTVVTGTSSPTITAAFDGVKFVSYGSATIAAGSSRLKRTLPVVTTNTTFAMVDFAWYEDPAYPSNPDSVIVQWSTDGTAWFNAGSCQRVNAQAGWKRKHVMLPPGANGQPTLYVAFLFTSANGNNCALDDVHVTAGPLQPAFATIGTGTLSSAYPFPTSWMGGRTQMLFTAAELTDAGVTAGNITSVGFNVITFSSQVMNGFSVKMGHTSLTSLSAGFVNGLTAYYTSPYAVPGTGWRDITLESPFVWNGSSNVIVEICYANIAYTANSPVYATTVTGKTAGHYDDSQTECSTTTFNAPANRPNIRFGVPSMSQGALMGYVRDAVTMLPVAGAVVVCGTRRDTSRADGFYIIYNLPAGMVNVSAIAAGYSSTSVSQSISAGAATQSDILLTPGPKVGGVITDASTGVPIIGATITIAGTTYTMSVSGGMYLTPPLSLLGTQTFEIEKTGYDPYAGVISFVPGITTTLNAALLPTAYPPGPMIAALNGTPGTSVNLSWSAPLGMYQLIDDDGLQDSLAVWDSAGNLNAVRFTPLGWPAKVSGGKVNLGQATNYPSNAPPLTPFTMLVYLADGPIGLPGTPADSTMVTPTGFGWNSFAFAAPVTIQSGSFYLAMKQGGIPPHAAGTGVDTTLVRLTSFSRNADAGSAWMPFPGNFMIRAIVEGSGGPSPSDGPSDRVKRNTGLIMNTNDVESPAGSTQAGPMHQQGYSQEHVIATDTDHRGDVPSAALNPIWQMPGKDTDWEPTGLMVKGNPGDLSLAPSYQVWRLLQGQEGNPALWISVATTGMTVAVDNAWPTLPPRPYRWAVKAVYSPPGQRYSSPSFSNVIGKNWTSSVTVCLNMNCTFDSKEGSIVKFTNIVYPDTSYLLITDTSGCVHFPTIWNGSYTLQVIKFSYQTCTLAVLVTGDTTLHVSMLREALPPRDLAVNPKSLQATWMYPLPISYQLQENWGSGSFATNQWSTSGGTNWQISGGYGNPAPSAMFNGAPANSDYHQYLTSKTLSGVNAPVMMLCYDIYLNNYTTSNLNTMTVELWNGITWSALKNYTNANGNIPWTTETLNITSQTGNQAFRIRFHAAGTNSYDINNWNIDNIAVYSRSDWYGPDPCITGYNFYLNNSLIGFTTDTIFQIPPELVAYGQTDTACVRTLYGLALSTPTCIPFTSQYLSPPCNLTALYIPETVNLAWDPPIPGSGPALTGYNVYRNGIKINTTPITSQTYPDVSAPMGLNTYRVTALYGSTESLPAGPVVVNVVPLIRTITNDTISSGMAGCFNAINTIMVAGNGSTFVVQNGGSATLIAGQNILCYPGTTIQNGGYMWGYISPDGPWCVNPSMPAIVPSKSESEKNSIENIAPTSWKVYPNPTTGTFVLDWLRESPPGEVVIEIYGMFGERILRQKLYGERYHQFSLTGKPSGIYLIRVITGEKTETVKIVKY